jgi:CRISPR/Cas system Type II protein with McrA/HNH and RuvC-like nuclease domain
LHIDHVIPWSFVLEDRIWNLVLSCRECNCGKSDRTPDDETLLELTRRNSALNRGLQGGRLPVESAAVRHDLQGFSDETLRAHVAAMIQNCRIDGFGVWSPVKSSSPFQSR